MGLEIVALLKLIQRLRTHLRASITADRFWSIHYGLNTDFEKPLEMFLILDLRKITSLNLMWSNDTEIGTRTWRVYSSHIENIDKQR